MYSTPCTSPKSRFKKNSGNKNSIRVVIKPIDKESKIICYTLFLHFCLLPILYNLLTSGINAVEID